MVDDLLNIIWENTDEDSEPQSFRYFFTYFEDNFSPKEREKGESDSMRPK
jgi:hypothetical protein